MELSDAYLQISLFKTTLMLSSNNHYLHKSFSETHSPFFDFFPFSYLPISCFHLEEPANSISHSVTRAPQTDNAESAILSLFIALVDNVQVFFKLFSYYRAPFTAMLVGIHIHFPHIPVTRFLCMSWKLTPIRVFKCSLAPPDLTSTISWTEYLPLPVHLQVFPRAVGTDVVWLEMRQSLVDSIVVTVSTLLIYLSVDIWTIFWWCRCLNADSFRAPLSLIGPVSEQPAIDEWAFITPASQMSSYRRHRNAFPYEQRGSIRCLKLSGVI